MTLRLASLALLILTIFGAYSLVPRKPEAKTFAAGMVRQIQVHSKSGDISLIGEPGGKLQVGVRALSGGADALSAVLTNGVLDLKTSAPIQIGIPNPWRSGSIEITSDEGSVSAKDLFLQHLFIAAPKGNVKISGVDGGNVSLHSSTGSVEFEGTASDFNAESESGDVSMRFVRASPSQLSGKSQTGQLLAKFTIKPDLNLRVETGTGEVMIDGQVRATDRSRPHQEDITFGSGVGKGYLRTGSGKLIVDTR